MANYIVLYCSAREIEKVELYAQVREDAREGPFEKPRFGLRKAAGFQSAIENDQDDTEKSSFSGAALLNENNGYNSGGCYSLEETTYVGYPKNNR
uniref:Bm299 n=1 Tax=Brugia malayi TaxID=6279 RepID=A0A1I9GDQ0_BRUMA|nr:Bm299 [Brugia malayi]